MTSPLVVVPTYNERDNLEGLALRVLSTVPGAHVLVVDDGSPDGTGGVADRLAREQPLVHVLHRAGPRGLGLAYKDGFRHAIAHGHDPILQMDADGSHDPAYLPALVDATAGADLAVGSRYVAGGGIEGWGLDRLALSRGGSLYARTVLGVHVRDLTSGFKAWRRAALERIDLDEVHSEGYCFQIEMTWRALRAGLSVVEVPIVFVDRQVGRSKMSRRIVAEAVWRVWALRLRALRGD